MKQNVRQIKLRLTRELHAQLVEQAQLHGHTVNAEIRQRLEASREQGARSILEDICRDMDVTWARYSGRLLSRKLADEIADAVMQGSDHPRLRTLAQLIIEQRNVERLPCSENKSGREV